VTTLTATQPAAESQGGFLALMRHRNYALLWTGQLISHLGDRFHWVAISLWVYAQTGSALSVSYAIVALMVAPALVGLFAGAVADRYDRRRIMIVTDLLRAVLVAAIPALMPRGLPWVYGALFLMSAASAFFRPAMWAAVPQAVPRDRLLQANAYFASLESAVEVAGPALAGLLIMRFSYAAAMYVDAVSYLVSAVFVAGLRLAPVAGHRSGMAVEGPKGILASIREGLRYVRGDRIQVALLAFLFLGQWVVGLSSLQTPLAKGEVGISDHQFGWFQSVWGAGFVAASVTAAWLGGRVPKGQAIVLGYLLWALAVATMAFSVNLGMLVVTGFWVGFANILVFVNVSTILMEHTPSDKLGRAITVRQIGVAVVRASALLGFGWLADLFGVRETILAMAGLALAGTIVATLRFPALWRYSSASNRLAPRSYDRPHFPLLQQLVEPSISGVVLRLAGAHIDQEFAHNEQRWLNAACLTIVAFGWLVLVFHSPGPAIAVAASAWAATLIPRLVQGWWRRRGAGAVERRHLST
jgi:MFS family permease